MPQYIFKNPDFNYTAVNNEFIDDDRLGFDDVGFLLRLLRRPPNWRINPSELAKTYGVSEKTVLRRLKKLEETGYIRTHSTIVERKNGLQRHRFCSDVGIRDASFTLMVDQLDN